MDKGLIDANLGGGLFKKRVAAPGRGHTPVDFYCMKKYRDTEFQGRQLTTFNTAQIFRNWLISALSEGKAIRLLSGGKLDIGAASCRLITGRYL